MRYRLREVRIFPIAVLLLFILLMALNLRSKSRPLSDLSLLRQPGRTPASLKFDEFSPAVYDVREGRAVTDSFFELTSNEKSEEVMCRVKYRTRRDEDQVLIFSWYLGNALKRRDTLWAASSDTLCKSIISIPRNEAGQWSVDISLKENILLSTLCFELTVKSAPRHFRSLKGES